MENIIIKGAKEHNLKNIDLIIPRNKLTVITGISGSGKSTLAFDTIYAEGQRRYVESLSTYARQFLGILNKPDVEMIEGLSPAIAIDQKTTSRNPRSTVGTVTEIYDYLRLLFAKIGDVYCPKCNKLIDRQTIGQIADNIMKLKEGTKIAILSPIVRDKKGEHKHIIENIQKNGFVRMRIDGNMLSIADEINLDANKKHNIDIVVDRLVIEAPKKQGEKDDFRIRVLEAVELSVKFSNGYVIVLDLDNNKEYFYSENFACPTCDINLPEITPKTFSFNSPQGACTKCHGLGVVSEFDIDLIVPNQRISINEGAIIPLTHYSLGWIVNILEQVSHKYNIDLDIPFYKLTKQQKDFIFFGSNNNDSNFKGILHYLKDKYINTDSESVKDFLSEYMKQLICDECNGNRLKKEALFVKIEDKNIIDITNMSIKEALIFFTKLNIKSINKKQIATPILKEITKRLEFLSNVGLNYLTLSRSASTLSGGESQRIRLATQVGLKLTGVLYVLDEPSIGLHQRDNGKLLNTLIELKNLDNTVIVVEHDEETMKKADFIIDMGPKAGKYGGQIIATGTIDEIKKNENSITGQYLSNKKSITIPKKRRAINKNKYIEIIGAQHNNLKNINVKIPLNVFIGVSGVSGSGKSSLIKGILVPALMQKIYKSKCDIGKFEKINGLQMIDKIISVNQEPIGRTPRSNPATYTGIFDDIRNLFAQTKDAQIRGYKVGRFSFNVKGGRCENCKGDGVRKIEMHFLPDVYIECEVCNGKRYNNETLEILYHGKNISDVLNMTVSEAIDFFENIPTIKNKLSVLQDVGLDYIHLGQSATTLSGGEAQRIKLATELSKKHTGNTLYVLDEPTTGLHFADIDKLLSVLHRLVDLGNTVLVIEHNIDVLKCCDYIIDMGPEGGDEGGQIVATGTPEEIAKNPKSYTGIYLKEKLKK